MSDLKLRAERALPAPTHTAAKPDLHTSTSLHSSAGLIPLVQVPRALIAGGFTDKPVDYARLYRAVVSGAIPAEQVTSNRWSVRSTDLPDIAKALGLVSLVEPAALPEARAPRAPAFAAA